MHPKLQKLRYLVLTLNFILVLFPWLLVAILQSHVAEQYLKYSPLYPDGFLWIFCVFLIVDIIISIVYGILKIKYHFKAKSKNVLFWIILILLVLYTIYIVHELFQRPSLCCVPPLPSQFPKLLKQY